MKILFISHYCPPHIGGVEKHVESISKVLKKNGHKVVVIAKDHPLKYPDIKFVGLIKIWVELFKLRKVIKDSDVIHIHDVFIWYLPFRFLYPNKKVYITFHGGRQDFPSVPFKYKFFLKIAHKLTDGSIAVGGYIGKYFQIKPNAVIYGGVSKNKPTRVKNKIKNSIVWLGRLDKESDLPQFLDWLKNEKRKYKVVFVGDGDMKKECSKFGEVVGFVKDPKAYISKPEIVVPVGYLSYLEAKQAEATVMTFPKTSMKKDYWRGIEKLSIVPTWESVVDVYLKLWGTTD
ncbi:glycosyltransferase family 4 protein [Candidatus Microgenomates bacterium]|nr:glycosyltransferase family 4 protein [Candidatus Microgenomates bacterium]